MNVSNRGPRGSYKKKTKTKKNLLSTFNEILTDCVSVSTQRLVREQFRDQSWIDILDDFEDYYALWNLN